MLKLLLAAVVIAGVIVGAAAFSARHHSSGPVQTGPVVVTVQVPNPLGGGQSGGNDQTYVP
jgi:predicted ribosomally synthesized peptide with SipW-like signal peptide